MKQNVLTSTLVPILSTVVTAFQVTRDWETCVLFFILSLVVLYFVKKKFKDKREYRISGYICASIMMVSSVAGLVNAYVQNDRNERWEAALRDEQDFKLETLIAKAEANDGPALMELSDYYYEKKNYKLARDYAQMAADKGNSDGYTRLVYIDYWGLGCKPNHQRAFSNMIKGQRTNYLIFGYPDLKDGLSETDSLKLAATERGHARIVRISDELLDANRRGLEAEKACFARNHDELVELYSQDFAPAGEFLYVEAWLNGDGKTMSEYARELYKINRIPTGPRSRNEFLLCLRPQDGYMFSDYRQHIEENDYLPALVYDAGDPEEDRSNYADSLLFQEYELFRAQYDWYRRLSNGTIREVRYVIGADKEVPELLEDAKTLLKQNIMAVKEREKNPNKPKPDDYRTDYGWRKPGD